MAMWFYGAVIVDGNGQVHYEFHTGAEAERAGVAPIAVRVHLGRTHTAPSEGELESDVLLGLECLGQVIQAAGRDLAWSYSLLPPNAIQREAASMTGE